ncbi:MAG: ATP-binding protein [Acetobacteraceae bacterium]
MSGLWAWTRTCCLAIRGKILLAFLVMAAITGLLGRYAVTSVMESGRLVAQTYDRPLMSISYARLALADFNAMRLAWERLMAASDTARQDQLTTRLVELARSVRDDLDVAEERSSSAAATEAARQSRRSFDAWEATLDRALDQPAMRGALHQQAEAVLAALDNLGELTAQDGFRDRERALWSVERYYRLTIAATIIALLVGTLVAVMLARKMVSPIAAASRAATRIAAGDLDADIAPAGRDELGQLLSAMSVMRDNIRTMMEREVAARRSAQGRLIDAIEGAHVGVALLDRERRLLIANTQMRVFFPSEASALVEGALLPQQIAAAIADPAVELCVPGERWLRLSQSRTNDGGYVLIASDITLLKEREAALRLAKEAADGANRAKTEFLTNMSHELRTPLSSIIGFSEMIVHEAYGPVGDPKYLEFADDIMHSGRHLLDIISEILDVAKLQSGTLELRLRRLRPAVLLEEAVRIVRKQAADAGVRLETEVARDLPMIHGDGARLRQVLLNLLSNAIKFTPPGGSIVVCLDHHGGGIRMDVRDSGIGMAKQDIPRALEPFGQVDTSLSRRHAGTGLGLPLSKMFVISHGGSLEIDSEPGRGTTVSVTLPAGVRRGQPELLHFAD